VGPRTQPAPFSFCSPNILIHQRPPSAYPERECESFPPLSDKIDFSASRGLWTSLKVYGDLESSPWFQVFPESSCQPPVPTRTAPFQRGLSENFTSPSNLVLTVPPSQKELVLWHRHIFSFPGGLLNRMYQKGDTIAVSTCDMRADLGLLRRRVPPLSAALLCAALPAGFAVECCSRLRAISSTFPSLLFCASV